MRDPKRIPRILDLLRDYWIDHPDLRLGQIITNSTCDSGFLSIFYIEDDELEEALKKQIGDER